MIESTLVALNAKKKNGRLASKLEQNNSLSLKRVLVFFGRPFFLALLMLSIGLLYGVSSLGLVTRIIVTSITKIPTLSLPTFHFPKLRFYLPFPKITVRRSIKILSFFFVLLLIPTLGFWFFILKDLPPVETLVTRPVEVSTKIYDRNGIPLYKIYKDKNRTPIPLSDIPQEVRLSTLAAEDAEFYQHKGFSIRGISRAFFKNINEGKLSGGSTITQQLVKNALLTPEKTITRKLKEIALAVKVEYKYTKDQILEMYLNEVSYGGTEYGIQEAAEAYFGKKVQKLTLAESAYLAGLPKSPSKYSPFSGNLEAGINRQKDILNLMEINGFISKDQEEDALKEKLVFAENKIDIKAPHFVMYVRGLLADKYGEDALETGGLDVYTTLDYNIQKMAEEIVKKDVDSLKKLQVGNGAAVVLDPSRGEILAMVGSKDYFDTASDGNVNVVIRPRQPGSSIKVVNYAYALSTTYTPATIIDDAPITFNSAGTKPYTPKNYDGNFHGKVPLRNALAQSLNIPAVKVLNSYGVKNMIEMGKKLGLTTWNDESRFGLSLTLGGGEVKLLELANVYATIANYGTLKTINAIKKVTDYKNDVLEEESCTECPGTNVLDPRVAYLLIDILKDNEARAPSFGRFSQLVIPNHPEVAVKTGTSNDLKDNLTIGFTKNYVVATWVGNNDNTPMSRIASGLTGASTIFNEIMKNLLKNKEVSNWNIPPGLVQLAVCRYTGSLPCEGCPTKAEWFLQEKKPSLSCRPDQILALKEAMKEKQGDILENGASTEFMP